jgi:hypothetical protein
MRKHQKNQNTDILQSLNFKCSMQMHIGKYNRLAFFVSSICAHTQFFYLMFGLLNYYFLCVLPQRNHTRLGDYCRKWRQLTINLSLLDKCLKHTNKRKSTINEKI